MDLAQSLTEEVWGMELVNNDSRLLLVAISHRNITSISNTLVWTILALKQAAWVVSLLKKIGKCL